MATMYMVNLEERVDIARHQLDSWCLRLRSISGQSRPEDIERTLGAATAQLEHIGELMGSLGRPAAPGDSHSRPGAGRGPDTRPRARLPAPRR